MLSKKSKYALRALLALAQKRKEGPVLIADLAREEKIPKKFLELILLELKNKGILQSKKGKGGGYFLDKKPDEVHLGEVIRALDGSLAPLSCVSQMAHRKCDECENEFTCGLRSVMQEVRDSTAKILDGTTLTDLIRRTETLEQEKRQVVSYSI